MTNQPRRFDLIGSLALIASILCWSLMPVMLKSFKPYISGWESNAIRYPFAAMLWFGPLLYLWSKDQVRPEVWKWALVPTVVNSVAQGLWAWLPYFLDAALIGFLVRISIFFAIAGGLILFKDERPVMKSPLFWFGAVFCIGGFVVMNGIGGELPQGVRPIGVLLVLICGMFYGMYGVTVRYFMRGIRPWVAFPVISIYTSFVMIGLLFAFEPDHQVGEVAARHPLPFLVILLSALIGIAMAHTFFYISLERLGAAISGGMQLIGSFLTALWAYLWFGEKMTWIQWQGGILLLFGGALLLSAQTRISPKSMDPKEVPIEPRVPD